MAASADITINGRGRSRADAVVWIADSDPAALREQSRDHVELSDWRDLKQL